MSYLEIVGPKTVAKFAFIPHYTLDKKGIMGYNTFEDIGGAV